MWVWGFGFRDAVLGLGGQQRGHNSKTGSLWREREHEIGALHVVRVFRCLEAPLFNRLIIHSRGTRAVYEAMPTAESPKPGDQREAANARLPEYERSGCGIHHVRQIRLLVQMLPRYEPQATTFFRRHRIYCCGLGYGVIV